MPCIVTDGTFKIYVYSQDHNPPHRHVFWAGNKVAVVNLLPFGQSQGDRLPGRGLALVQSHLPELLDAWQRLNP